MIDNYEIVLENAVILIVDDTPQNIDILVESLFESSTILVATNGVEALEIVSVNRPDIILLDIMMPEMNGFEVCRRLKDSEETKDIPIIFLTGLSEVEQKTEGFKLGAVDYITKPFDILEVKARVRTHLMSKVASDFIRDENRTLEDLVVRRTREIENTRDVTIRMAASLAETRDNETGDHILRTQRYVELLAGQLSGLTHDEISLMIKSAPLHDIGKIGVPDRILLKPGKLSEEEFSEMKKHTVYGREALERAEEQIHGESFLRIAREIAFTHHEKWDGSGYPSGSSGEDIPLSGRIMAIADVYDALISRRVYKPPFTHSKAVSIIEEGRGTDFDPQLVDIFLKIHERFRSAALLYAETDEERHALNS